MIRNIKVQSIGEPKFKKEGAKNKRIIGDRLISNVTIPTKDLDEYKQIFSMFDKDGSGAIGKEELKEAMVSIGIGADEKEIEDLIHEVDYDGNGEIDFQEFCACIRKSQSRSDLKSDITRNCFDVFDLDGNGVISDREFLYVAIEIGEYSKELAIAIFNDLDTDSKGYITAQQFGASVDEYLSDEY